LLFLFGSGLVDLQILTPKSCSGTLHLQTNGGVMKCNTRGLLDGYGYVWCDTRAIANIISLDNAKKQANLTHHIRPSKAL